MPMQVGRFTASDGVSLSYRTLGGERAAHTLVCHPGGPGLSGKCFGDLCALGSRRLRIVLLDPRGSGPSDPSPGGRYEIERYAADVEALRGHLGVDRIHLLGHGHGGFVAQSYAMTHPDAVDRLVLAHTAARFGPQLRNEAAVAHDRHRAEPWFEDAMMARVQRREIGYGDGAEAARLFLREVRLWFAADGAPYTTLLALLGDDVPDVEAVRWFDEHVAPGFDSRDRLATIGAPTLILTGAADWIGPRISTIELSAIPNSQMHLMAGCGHWSFLERPDDFRAELEEFLEL